MSSRHSWRGRPALRHVASIVPALALWLAAQPGAADSFRSPQVYFDSAPLASYMNAHFPNLIVLRDQLAVQTFSPADIHSFPRMTVGLRLGTTVTVGLYAADQASPLLAPVFVAGQVPGDYAVCHFGASQFIVDRFDSQAVYLGRWTYPAMSGRVGFFVQGPCGTWFSEDARNVPPGPQVLVYENTLTVDDLELCFEPCASSEKSQFISAIVEFQNRWPDPAAGSTWGRLKAAYR